MGKPQDNQGNPIQEVMLADESGVRVTTRATAGPPAIGQTAKIYTGKVALSTTATTTSTLETVTAGKTYYITDIYLSADTTQQMDVRIQAAGVDIFRCVVKGDTAPVQMPGLETQPFAASGQSVTILWPIITGAVNGYFMVSGYEQ